MIPDGIEAIEGWRSWRLEQGKLRALYRPGFWPVGEPARAECSHVDRSWEAEEGGLSLATIQEVVATANHNVVYSGDDAPNFPNVALPEGWGYRAVEIRHDAPGEGCKCGLYAVAEREAVETKTNKAWVAALSLYPTKPKVVVVGRVSLWGKVIPGESGWRAEFGYPLELFVTSEEHAAAAEKYGVPVRVEKPPAQKTKRKAEKAPTITWLSE